MTDYLLLGLVCIGRRYGELSVSWSSAVPTREVGSDTIHGLALSRYNYSKNMLLWQAWRFEWSWVVGTSGSTNSMSGSMLWDPRRSRIAHNVEMGEASVDFEFICPSSPKYHVL